MIFLLQNIKKSLPQKYNWLQWSVPPPNILARKDICCSSWRELSFQNGTLKCSPKLQLCHKYDRFKLWQLRNYIYEKLQGYDLFALTHKDLISWVKYPEHSSCVKIIERCSEKCFSWLFLRALMFSLKEMPFVEYRCRALVVAPGWALFWVNAAGRQRRWVTTGGLTQAPACVSAPHVLRMPHIFLIKAAQITTRKIITLQENLAEIRPRRYYK